MDKIDLIYNIVTKMDDKVDGMSINVNDNTKDLKQHMARTEASEKRLGHIEDKLTITYLLKVVASAVITSGAIAAAIYKITQVIQ